MSSTHLFWILVADVALVMAGIKEMKDGNKYLGVLIVAIPAIGWAAFYFGK